MGTLRLWVKSGDLEHVLVYRARAGTPRSRPLVGPIRSIGDSNTYFYTCKGSDLANRSFGRVPADDKSSRFR